MNHHHNSRLAHWGRGRLAFQPSEMRLANMLGKTWSLILVDRTVVISECKDGIEGWHQANNMYYPHVYEWCIPGIDVDLARFQVDAIEVVGDLSDFEYTIPPDRDLPWPKLSCNTCLEVVETEFRKRLRSCNLAKTDPRDIIYNVPQIARDLIGSAGTWTKIVNEELELT